MPRRFRSRRGPRAVVDVAPVDATVPRQPPVDGIVGTGTCAVVRCGSGGPGLRFDPESHRTTPAGTVDDPPAGGSPGSRVSACPSTPPPAKRSRRCSGTRRGRSSGARPGPVTSTPSGSSAAGAASSTRSSTYRSNRTRRGGSRGRPAARDPVPSGGRARLRGPRRRDPVGRRRHRERARVHGGGGGRGDRRHRREFADRGGFDTDDEEYGKLVEAVITDEIGQGEGANLVIGRHYRATVADWGHDKALTVFSRLLERERGAYWTFLFFTGDRYLIGASPERHVTVHGGDVRMNPISGTFRLRGATATSSRASSTSSRTRRRSTSSSWSSTRSSR